MSRDQRQVWLGMLAAVFSVLIVFGGFALALAQSGAGSAALILPTSWQSATPVATALPGEPTFTPVPPSPTPPPITPTTCPPPAGWIGVEVGPDDTLDSLAAVYGTTAENLAAQNCVPTSSLLPGSILYVPPLPSPTAMFCPPPPGWQPVVVGAADTLYSLAGRYGTTAEMLATGNCLALGTALAPGSVIYAPQYRPPPPTVCVPPLGWVPYFVRSGDTLYSIGLAFHISAAQLQAANCLPSSYLEAGWMLYVPFVLTPTPFWPPTLTPPIWPPTITPPPFISPTFTFTPSATWTPPATFTATWTPQPATWTPTATASTLPPTFTATLTTAPSATATPSAAPSATPTPSSTPGPTATATLSPTPSWTPTEPRTPTFTVTNTAPPTFTFTPSPAPTLTPTSTPTP